VNIEQTGIPTREEIESCYPSRRAQDGPVAVFECFQRIPCDPCYWACPQHAVLPFEDINDLPKVDLDKCTGCGICVGRCPGLAVFVVQEHFDGEFGLVKMPHEFLPLPSPGDTVELLDRSGEPAGQGKVISVTGRRKGDTPVVSVSVPAARVKSVRAIRVGGMRP